MPDWGGIATNAGPYVAGALSTGGDIYSAQANRAEAERNRQFQERMSSTAIQRAVEDYKAAGLNPGLAYERGASSPGGAQANIGNPLASGIASAMQAKQMQQAMQIAKAQSDMDLAVKEANVGAAHAANARDNTTAQNNIINGRIAQQLFDFQHISNPSRIAMLNLERQMMELGIPRAEYESGKSGIKRDILRSGISSARSFKEAMYNAFSDPLGMRNDEMGARKP